VVTESLSTSAIKEESTSRRNSLNSLINQYGILPAAWLIIRYVLRKILRIDWQRTILFERLLADPIQEVVPKIKVNIERATVEDLEKLKGMVDEAKYNRFRQRFDRGNICFVARDGDKIAAFSWISFDREFEVESQIEIKLNYKEAYGFDTYVEPEYRNNRLQSAMEPTILKYLRSQGYEKMIGLVDKNNIYALKGLLSAGNKPKRIATLIRIFDWKIQWWQKYADNL